MKSRSNKEIVREINHNSEPQSGAKQSKKDDVLDTRRKNNLPEPEDVKNATPVANAARDARDKQLDIHRDSVTQYNSGCN